MVPEAQLRDAGCGLVAASTGWFVMNARDARWFHRPSRGDSLPLTGCDEFEAETYFPMLGMSIQVLGPGEPNSIYHWETEQENFLVLAGEALLIVEGQERRLELGLRALPAGDPARVRRRGRRPVRDPRRLVAAVPERRAVGLLLRRRDRPPLQRELAGGHAGRGSRV